MRFPTVFISTAFVLAAMSAAFAVERENMLVARFADPDFLAEVEARTYDEEPELYARGGVLSNLSSGWHRKSRPTSYRSASSAGTSMIALPPFSRTASRQTGYSGTTLTSSSSHPSLSRTGSDYSGTTSASFHTSHSRRSLYEPFETGRRRDQRWRRYGYNR
ncbi:hypothetical protein M378DRAFT_156659 [Amanita muscaria Koide BX008]|uniref:Uncharacterized protein n=1 Tax=Amanita muscaria (strain Koide BX008) TaxID=946122 RepID=A0A0C2TTA6_AMAMK|nr:hypothetical protein M378DRAFT_156659 [Amanita muscaria Koide BX008]